MQVTRGMRDTWRAVRGFARRRRAATATVLVVAGLAAAISVQAVTAGGAAAGAWRPSAAQVDQAIIVAYLEASSTVPSAAGAPVTPYTMPVAKARSLLPLSSRTSSWPSNVTSVEYIGSHRQDASRYVDGSTVPDNRQVIVLRMTGRFSVLVSAPPGAPPYETGTVLTAVVDANTGEVLDFGLADSAKPLPDPQVVFSRPARPAGPATPARAGHVSATG